jgi:hypothetical protein
LARRRTSAAAVASTSVRPEFIAGAEDSKEELDRAVRMVAPVIRGG